MLSDKYKLTEKDYNYLKKALSKGDINDFFFYITPYHELEDYYKWQVGATSSKINLKGEFDDDFDTNNSDFCKNYDYDKHIDTLINDLGYKQIEFDTGKIPYLLKEATYGFINISF